MDTHHLPARISIPEAARLLGMRLRTAYRRAAQGYVPTVRFERRVMVPTAKLLDLLGIEQLAPPGLLPDGHPQDTTEAA